MFGADANWGRVLCAMGYSKAPSVPNTSIAASAPPPGYPVCKVGEALDFDEDIAKQC